MLSRGFVDRNIWPFFSPFSFSVKLHLSSPPTFWRLQMTDRDREHPSPSTGTASDIARAAATSSSSSEASTTDSVMETDTVVLGFDCETLGVSWTVLTASFEERLNSPFCLRLSIATDDLAAEAVNLLGETCSFTFERGSMYRRVTGIVAEVGEYHTIDNRVHCDLVITPALELQRHKLNTRIFQQKTVPEILEEVLEADLSDYDRNVELRLTRDYPTCEYRTQYNESDLDFCQRLMEEEGIIFWFEFDDDTENLVLADSADSYEDIQSLHGNLLRFTEYEAEVKGHEYVDTFRVVSQIRPTKISTRHFDWTHPPFMVEQASEQEEVDGSEARNGSLFGPQREQYEHGTRPITFYDYDTVYNHNDAEDQRKLRREQQAYDTRVIEGRSTVIGIKAGQIFELRDHPRAELNMRYLVLSVFHELGDKGARNAFRCIPARTPFRPRRETPRPRIVSIQTATVVGPAGEEVHTDIHGRIKVQFHWDREGSLDEHSSCYVRVIQPWAGPGWGFVFLPRIGMEVVVTFVNGDPDQPLIAGAVYNATAPTPYPLPLEKAKGVIKTNSIHGTGYNELTFDDTGGAEHIIVHAQKDYTETVENDQRSMVHHDKTIVVDRNMYDNVGGYHSENVGADQDVNVSGERKVRVEGNQVVSVEGGQSRHLVTGEYLLSATTGVKINSPEKLTIKIGTGTSSLSIEPNRIVLESGCGAKLILDERVTLKSSQGSTVQLDENAEMSSSKGAKVQLTANGELASSGGATVKVEGPLVMLN